MTRADYGRIAQCYDRNPRRRHDPDLFLGDRLARAGRPPFVVLDVGCGTGSYLTAQLAAHAKAPVQWLGLDLSGAMLAHAKQKAPRAQLVLGRAEQLPYLPDSVDYVVTTFAFHHFEDKHRALDEMRRVARRDAAFRLVTIASRSFPTWRRSR